MSDYGNLYYCWNGESVSDKAALSLVVDVAFNKGYDPLEVAEIWRNRDQEEARDSLFTMSECQLEVVDNTL